jgi:tight adherence protein C
MSALGFVFGIPLAALGVAVAVSALRRPVVDLAAYLADFEVEPSQLDSYSETLTLPFFQRTFGAAGKRMALWVAGLLPGNWREKLTRRLVLAGLGERLRAEEFVTMQGVALAAGAIAGTLLAKLMSWGGVGTFRAIVLFAIAGAVAPEWVLIRLRERRQTTIRRDLPEVLDLLAVSVEAGLGLEQAIDVVTEHFDSCLTHELARMLRQMELGQSRRSALQDLKRRTNVAEVSSFVLSLIQADALGMPIGKVLRVQANELRNKRRQWARERAAKLPVKILGPLLFLIFPAMFVVILGPAVISISKNL